MAQTLDEASAGAVLRVWSVLPVGWMDVLDRAVQGAEALEKSSWYVQLSWKRRFGVKSTLKGRLQSGMRRRSRWLIDDKGLKEAEARKGP